MKHSVLILDDDQYIQQMLSTMLQADGYRVFGVRNAASASSILRRQEFSLAVVDYLLPDLDGISWIAAERGRGCKTPFLFLSGVACDASMQRRLRNLFQVDLILRKPVDPRYFLKAVRDLIGVSGDDDEQPAENDTASHDYVCPNAADPAPPEDDQNVHEAPCAEVSCNGRIERKLATTDGADEQALSLAIESLELEYLGDVPRLLRELACEIDACLETKEGQAIAQAIMSTHRLKGGAGTFSLSRLSRLADALETSLLEQADLQLEEARSLCTSWK